MADARCSPNTQRIASLMLDLPHPFGPTIAVMPSWNFSSVRSANDLNPWRLRRFSFIVQEDPCVLRENLEHRHHGVWRGAGQLVPGLRTRLHTSDSENRRV